MKLKIVAVIAARMGASRFPGKVLAPILGRPVLSLLIERVKRAKTIDDIVVATTMKPEDDKIAVLAKKEGVKVFRGSEKDVLGRVIGAAEKLHGDIVVRLTGDNPITDPVYIDKGVKLFLTGKYDYVSNTNVKQTMPRGFDVEVVTLKTLKEVARHIQDPIVREHVTPYFYRHPEKYRLKAFGPAKKDRVSNLHLAVDTQEDLELVRQIFEQLYARNPLFGYHDVMNLLHRHPKLKAISQISSNVWKKNTLNPKTYLAIIKYWLAFPKHHFPNSQLEIDSRPSVIPPKSWSRKQ